MMDTVFNTILFFTLLGVVLRIVSSRFEGVHLQHAWDYLCRGTEEDHAEDREDFLGRIGMALSAARLGQILSILLIVPSLLMLTHHWLRHYSGGVELSTGRELALYFLLAVLLAFFFSIMRAWFFRDFYDPQRPSRRSRMPEWLTQQNHRPPAPAAAGAILWDWVLRGCEWISRRIRAERPKAYLVEQDDEILLAVGEHELEAFGSKRTDEEATRGHDERTEREMIRSIQRLDRTLVREVMRPLNKVASVALPGLTAEKFLQLARRTGYTRFPCYYDQVTNLIGYLNVHDFLERPELPTDIRRLVHDAPFLPEIAQVDVALQEMLRLKSQVAICFDEFGGCSGFLTREDIFEEITGEIFDEYDRAEELKLLIRRGHYIADASIDLDDLAESIGLVLEKDNCDTLAGYVYHLLSRVPRRGESIDSNGWKLEVLQMDHHRIRKMRLTPPPDAENGRSENGGGN